MLWCRIAKLRHWRLVRNYLGWMKQKREINVEQINKSRSVSGHSGQGWRWGRSDGCPGTVMNKVRLLTGVWIQYSNDESQKSLNWHDGQILNLLLIGLILSVFGRNHSNGCNDHFDKRDHQSTLSLTQALGQSGSSAEFLESYGYDNRPVDLLHSESEESAEAGPVDELFSFYEYHSMIIKHCATTFSQRLQNIHCKVHGMCKLVRMSEIRVITDRRKFL